MMLVLVTRALALDITLNPGDDIVTATSALGPGDVVTLSEGVYTIAGPVDWTGAGTEEAPITIKGQGDVTIEITAGWTAAYVHDATWMNISNIHFQGAATITDDHDAFYAENTDHLSVTDCEMGPAFDDGAAFGGNNTALTFERNHVHDMLDGNGLYIGCYDASCWTQDSSISENWIHNIGGDYHIGIYLLPGGQNNVIRDNVIYQVSYGGLAVTSTEYGDPNVVEGNAIWNTVSYGLGVYGASVVRNNVVFNVQGRGIQTGDNGRNTLDNLVITHNTVYNTTDYGIYIESWAGRTGMVLANNAVANTTGLAIAATQGNVDDTNYISNNVASGWVNGLTLYAGSAQPVIGGGGETDFEDPVSWNYYPSQTSALIGVGDPSANAYVPETDFNGAARNGDAPDAGAYEWDGDGNPGWLISEGYKDLEALSANPGDTVGGGCCGAGKEDDTDAAALLLVPFAIFGLRRRRRG